MIKKFFCTSRDVLKKIICTLAAFLLCLGAANAMTPAEVQEQIQRALEVVKRAEMKLRLRAPRLTDIWIKEKTNDEGHAAEVELRRLYPQEYMEYIAARANLDDLLYTQYLIFANGKAE